MITSLLSFPAQSEWCCSIRVVQGGDGFVAKCERQVNKSIRLNQYETISLFIKSTFYHYFLKLKFSVDMNLLRKQTDAVCHLFLIKLIVTLRLYYTGMKWVRVLCQQLCIVCWCNECAICGSLHKMLSDMGPAPFYAQRDYAIWIWPEYTASFHWVWFYEINRLVNGMPCHGVLLFIWSCHTCSQSKRQRYNDSVRLVVLRVCHAGSNFIRAYGVWLQLKVMCIRPAS